MISILLAIAIYAGMIWYTVFYSMSVGPAQLEQKIGEKAYKICGNLRQIGFMGFYLSYGSMILYFFFPFEQGIPKVMLQGSLGWGISILLGAVLLVFGLIILKKALVTAKDSLKPDKKNKMNSGIYEKIRHPQAIGDVTLGFSLALFFNSPFLMIAAIAWVPINLIITLFEEKDLKIRYGTKYIEYMNRTGRFIPRIL